MKLIDTCGWIEWLIDGKLANSFAPHFKHIEELVIPTIIQYELYKWISREKNKAIALEIIGITERGCVVPLDSNISLYAAELSKEYNLAMADAIVYATSLRYNALLITSDKHFYSLPQIKFFEK